MKKFILFIIFVPFMVNAYVLNKVFLTPNDVAVKNYGQFEDSSSFYNNPALLGGLKNTRMELNYGYNNDGFDFNSAGINISLPLVKKIGAGFLFHYFAESTGEDISYNEIKVSAGLGTKIWIFNAGLLLNYNRLSFRYYESRNNTYNQITFIPGIIYNFNNLRVSFSYKNKGEQFFGFSYKFNDLNSIGISVKKVYNNIDLALTGFASIISDKTLFRFGISPLEYSAGLRFLLPFKLKKSNVVLNYSFNYNINTFSGHYAGIEWTL